MDDIDFGKAVKFLFKALVSGVPKKENESEKSETKKNEKYYRMKNKKIKMDNGISSGTTPPSMKDTFSPFFNQCSKI